MVQTSSYPIVNIIETAVRQKYSGEVVEIRVVELCGGQMVVGLYQTEYEHVLAELTKGSSSVLFVGSSSWMDVTFFFANLLTLPNSSRIR